MVQSCETVKILRFRYRHELGYYKLLRGLYSMELAITIQTSSVMVDVFALLLYGREAYGTVMYTLTRPEL